MKNNSTDIKTQLILTMGGRGGVGKTVALVAIADYLQTKGYKFFCTDCDTENAGKISSFAHWFKDTAVSLNLRNVADCDKLLEGSANSKAPFVLADLPANASGDVASWWKTIATPETLKELGLGVIAVGVVTPQRGSAESVCEWMDTLGPNVRYLIALNRIGFERVPAPQQEAFAHWFALDTKNLPLQTFEIPHLHDPAMEAMASLGKLPSKAFKGTELFILPRQRIKQWRDAIHSQLDALGIFQPAENLVPANG